MKTKTISPAKIKKIRKQILEIKDEFNNDNDEKEVGIRQGLTMAVVILADELGREIVYGEQK